MKRGRARWSTLLASVLLAVSLALTPALAAAQSSQPPSLPMAVWGKVVDAQGHAMGGTAVTITAFLNGQAVGQFQGTTAQDGTFGGPGPTDPKLIIEGTDQDNGKTVEFEVNGVPAVASPSVVYQTGAVKGPVTLTMQQQPPSQPDPQKSTVTVSPSSVLADGSSTATITVTLLDSSGRPVAGKTVTLQASGGGSKITPATAQSDPNGVATFKVSDTQAETVTYTAKDTTDGVTLAQTVQVTFTASSGGGTGGGTPGGGAPAGGGGSAGPTPGNSVGSDGGTLATSDGAFTMSVPQGVVPSGSAVTVTESSSAPAGAQAPSAGLKAASAYFTLAGATLSQSIPATIKYSGDALGGLPPMRLSVYRLEADGSWAFVPTKVDPQAGTVTAKLSAPATYVILANSAQFSDVPSNYWAKDPIDQMLAASVIAGFPDGTFKPDASLTRAQFVKMLVLTLGLAPQGGTTPFHDVASDAWYAPYVATAFQAGLVSGVSPTAFSPDSTVTREQMAVLIARALKLQGTAQLAFNDAGKIDSWAEQGIAAAVAAGYLAGFPDGSFRPSDQTTRAQAAKVLAQAIVSMAP